jgi:hypothetical protein
MYVCNVCIYVFMYVRMYGIGISRLSMSLYVVCRGGSLLLSTLFDYLSLSLVIVLLHPPPPHTRPPLPLASISQPSVNFLNSTDAWQGPILSERQLAVVANKLAEAAKKSKQSEVMDRRGMVPWCRVGAGWFDEFDEQG